MGSAYTPCEKGRLDCHLRRNMRLTTFFSNTVRFDAAIRWSCGSMSSGTEVGFSDTARVGDSEVDFLDLRCGGITVSAISSVPRLRFIPTAMAPSWF